MAKAQPPGQPRARRTPLQALIYWVLVVGVWGLIFVVAFFAVFAVDLPDTSLLYEVKRQPSVTFLDRSGALLAVRVSQYAPPVDLDKLPPYVPKAFIAIEDRWYYWHFGFNPWGIARSQIVTLGEGTGTAEPTTDTDGGAVSAPEAPNAQSNRTVDFGLSSESQTHLGWTVGAGVEGGLTPNWAGKAEYLYVRLEDRGYVLTGVNNGFQSNVFRLGVNYRF